MAVHFATVSQYLTRTGSMLSGDADFTIIFWLSRGNTSPAPDYRTFYSLSDTTYDHWLWVGGSQTDGIEFYITDDGGLTSGDAITDPISANTWYGMAITYTAATTLWNAYWYNGGALIHFVEDGVYSWAGATIDTEYIGWDGIGAASNSNVGQFRAWQTQLTEDQILVELNNAFANYRESLFIDSPLHTVSDITDYSGNGLNWTAVGSPTTIGGLPVPWVQTFTDQAVMQQIQYAVIEPPDSGQTWPSGLWTLAEVAQYIDQRQNKFLKDTHVQFGIAEINVISGFNVYNLPDDWISTIRVLWTDEDGNMSELPRSDTWEADNGIPTWSYVAGTPKIFYDGGKPITIRLMPVPDTNGTLQIHYVPYSALIDGSGETFTLPSEFVPFVKYGAMADMLSKVGRAQDQSRAEYCAKRYQMGIEIARLLLRGF